LRLALLVLVLAAVADAAIRGGEPERDDAVTTNAARDEVALEGRPPIDREAPARFATATFALG
jgi:hypothetical protein